jgi:pimeloyl-ACP methyl ester carboxylesterase
MTTVTDLTVRPFAVHVPDEDLADLRRRIAAMRWPGKEVVSDTSQGVQLATIQDLVTYWGTEYDWRTCEAKLNALPQFVTEIDGLGIHFIHVRSRHAGALPLIITHGWPGSVIELLEVVGPLTDPTAHGGNAEDAFDLVIPSLPGYGFSAQPTSAGWDPGRTARAWAELMNRLGYTRYVAQGGDVGAGVTDAMAIQAPDGLVGIHLNFLRRPPLEVVAVLLGRAPVPTGFTDAERAALAAFGAQARKGYNAEQSQAPQTIGYSLNDSPAGLAAWMLDHDADSYKKISRAFVEGHPVGGLTRDRILDNITLYWLTNTAISSARLYWEKNVGFFDVKGVSIPTAVSAFPDELYQAPRSWTERAYPKLIYYNKLAEGGHFAAWEQPHLFSEEVRAAFRSLR